MSKLQVRPFVLGEVELAREELDPADPQVEDRITELLAAKVHTYTCKHVCM
jgi:hypothetical protein